MKTIDTLIPDIDELLSKQGHQPSQENIQGFVKAVTEAAMNLFTERQDKIGLRMSMIGKPCKRQAWYKGKGFKGLKLKPKDKRKFFYGHMIEAFMILLTKEAGHVVANEQARVDVDGVPGSLDCYIDGVLVDVKSASKYSFKKFQDGLTKANDAFGYIGQLEGYAEGMNYSGRKAWFVAGKEDGQLTLSDCPTTDFDVRKEIQEHKDNLAKDVPPERCFSPVPEGTSGNMKLGMECQYCDFKHQCWPSLRMFQYSFGTVYLTDVKKKPNVPEITTIEE